MKPLLPGTAHLTDFVTVAGGEYIFHSRVGKQWRRWWSGTSFKVRSGCDLQTVSLEKGLNLEDLSAVTYADSKD